MQDSAGITTNPFGVYPEIAAPEYNEILSMTEPVQETRIEQEYHISRYIIAYKLLFGIAEFLLGIGITFFGKKALYWYRLYAAHELSENPHFVLVRMTENILPNLLAQHTFLAFYLVLLGTVKIAGAIGLIYKQHWGVDLLVCVTLCMLPFQVVQILLHPSVADAFYISMGLLITLYLINFQPVFWIHNLLQKMNFRGKITDGDQN
jgi:uncharacterized membrane protein (DUF2068 family)